MVQLSEEKSLQLSLFLQVYAPACDVEQFRAGEIERMYFSPLVVKQKKTNKNKVKVKVEAALGEKNNRVPLECQPRPNDATRWAPKAKETS